MTGLNRVHWLMNWFVVIPPFCLMMAVPATGDITLLDAAYRADESFPQFAPFWHEDASLPQSTNAAGRRQTNSERLGGAIHIFVRNSSYRPLELEDVLLEGLSLRNSLAYSDQRMKRKFASIDFANMTEDARQQLVRVGEPVWFKIDPRPIPVGGVGQVVIRLRQTPQTPMVKLELVYGDNRTALTVRSEPSQPRVAGLSFSNHLDSVYMYFRRLDTDDRIPSKILLDGNDITMMTWLPRACPGPIVPAVVRLTKPLVPASLHCFQGIYGDGTMASASARVWADDFAYGIFGGMPGNASDSRLASQYLSDLISHNINVQMPQLGSDAVRTALKSPSVQRSCAARGLRFVVDAPGKWGVRRPYLFWIHDEPDCGDFLMKGVPEQRKIGGMAQWCVERSGELRQADASRLQILNLDMTYKPFNWCTYGQLPDVLAVDPYYQARLRTAYHQHPERIDLYKKATYIYACARVCQSACEPNPLHVILYACSHINNETSQRFRFPTPQEKRIEVYYALAAGAKGLSYWWYTPAQKGKGSVAHYGVGAATRDKHPAAMALWREIGLLGAEIRTAGPLLLRSCPTDLPIATTNGLCVRSLLTGQDTVLLLVTNEQYVSTDEGTEIRPVDAARLSLDIPAWIQAADVFEITWQGTREVRWQVTGANACLHLGHVDVTRLILITSDAQLRNRLQTLHDSRVASGQ